MTEQMAIENALNTHKSECKECTIGACEVGVSCLIKTDIEAYEELLKYRAIGTVEELQALKEKSVEKKPYIQQVKS